MTGKPPKTFDEQLAIMESRGLVVKDRSMALRHLASANYFRLNGYRHPFLQADSETFRPGTSFDQIWGLYRFDHRVRLAVMDAIERCEIAFRTRWAYELAHKYGPQSYEDVGLHKKPHVDASTLAKIDEEIARSHEDFLQPYRSKQIPGRPPIWMVCEVMSLGHLSNCCRNLKAAAVRTAIAAPFGLDESVCTSFMHHLTVVRNFCAHHSRIWNRRFTITFSLPQTKPGELARSVNPPAGRQIYNTIVVLAHLLDVIEPGNRWCAHMCGLLDSTDFDVYPHMGFPRDWRELPIWRGIPIASPRDVQHPGK